MKIQAEKIKNLLVQIDGFLVAIKEAENSQTDSLAKIAKPYRKSARNLVYYRALRKFDLRDFQKSMRQLGLSRFANAEGHIKASLLNTRLILQALIKDEGKKMLKSGLSIKSARRLLVSHTKDLLGYRSPGRRVRIMVTQPSEAANNYELVEQMVRKGMNVARINCAHDTPDIWLSIIKNIQVAAKASGRNVKIAMDLAGPKIRTGAIQPGPQVRKFKPLKNDLGEIIQAASVLLVPELEEGSADNALPIGAAALEGLNRGDELTFRDTRGKKRKLIIQERDKDGYLVAICEKTTYVKTGTVLQLSTLPEKVFVVGALPAVEHFILLKEGDVLRVDRTAVAGESAQYDDQGNCIQEAHISCQVPEIFKKIKKGHPVLFDDGKIKSKVIEVKEDCFRVSILRASEKGAKLRSEKGINFPKTTLGISGLTSKDNEDLKFVAEHADMVNFSFVNSKADVEELFAVLQELGAFNRLGVIFKIETRLAYNNLSEILMAAMQAKQVGVMIARGDLAVETGWDNIGLVQDEILAHCSAAHLPVVWATQVLENMAKNGLPSRSEMTDATISLRAECVMLNKGAYINDAIDLLDTILKDMEQYHDKKEIMLAKRTKLSIS
ncbi:pyruvate kinase [Lewinella sp. LCG006]|uniref:pyruvate kinase n=1 Tax=Lewinella sp. LCG006 TaxID=3231911 RepID=UPI0034604A73